MSEEIGVNVTTEQRLLAHNGTVFADAVGGNAFWLRYLDVFPWVRVIARVQQVNTLPDAAVPMIDKRIKFSQLSSFKGPAGLIRSQSTLWSRTKEIAQDDAAFILRIPGMMGSFLYWHLRSRRWPYAVEVIGDPNDSLSYQAIGENWAHIVRPIAVLGMQQQCRNATAASYVTKTTLQQRYPTNAGFSTHYSDVSDDLIDLTQSKKRIQQKGIEGQSTQVRKLIFVGSLAQRYKGLHILLQALKICKSNNITINLDILGDGFFRSEYEQLACQLGLEETVKFHGFVKQGAEVINFMGEADLFVMPSLVEGLPSAMIEAMACGLPCIGSNIGGIPELLASSDLVPAGDPQALADAITAMLNNPKRMKLAGQKNREVALTYRSEVLRPRRQQLYSYLRDVTLEHKHLISR